MTPLLFLAAAGFLAGGAISVARGGGGRVRWLVAVVLAGASSLCLANAMTRW